MLAGAGAVQQYKPCHSPILHSSAHAPDTAELLCPSPVSVTQLGLFLRGPGPAMERAAVGSPVPAASSTLLCSLMAGQGLLPAFAGG